jgi:hypothetical protein
LQARDDDSDGGTAPQSLSAAVDSNPDTVFTHCTVRDDTPPLHSAEHAVQSEVAVHAHDDVHAASLHGRSRPCSAATLLLHNGSATTDDVATLRHDTTRRCTPPPQLREHGPYALYTS